MTITIQYEAINGMKVTIKEKTFTSEDAMAKWADKMTEAGKLGQILRYSENKF